jgi:hypothetical protein
MQVLVRKHAGKLLRGKYMHRLDEDMMMMILK